MASGISNLKETKCWTCSRVIPKTCSWSLNYEPVPGWKASLNEHCDGTWSYAVEECPLYEDDRPMEAPDVFISDTGRVSYWCKRCGMRVGYGDITCGACKSQYLDWYEADEKRRRMMSK